MSVSERPPLNLFLLGVEKCGTTTLHGALAQHPDVCMSLPKETNFYCGKDSQDLAYYRSCFAHYRGEKILGEATPNYASMPFVAKKIALDYPDARLILCVRNPVERAYSHWKMRRNQGLERQTFGATVQACLEERVSFPQSQPEWLGYQARCRQERAFTDYLWRGQYASMMDCYADFFRPASLKVMVLEEWGQAGVSDLFEFLGLAPQQGEIAHEHRGRGPLLTKLFSVVQALGIQKYIPTRLGQGVISLVERQGDKYLPMDPDIRQRLLTYYQPFQRRLEEKLRRNLDWH